MSFRKGSRGHRVAGNVFVISKLSLAASAVYLALMKSQVTNVLGGVLTFYLVTTAWLAARRRDGETGMFDWGLLLIALTVGATLVTLGLGAAHSQTGLKYGAPAGLYFIFGSWALLADAGTFACLCGRCFWETTSRASSWAHVLCAVRRHRVFLPGTATSVPRFFTQNKRTFNPGFPAAAIADFLAIPSSLHKCIQENVDAARGRCLLGHFRIR
jgi:hypothetical protein